MKSSSGVVLPTSKSRHCWATTALEKDGMGSDPMIRGRREGCCNRTSTEYIAAEPHSLVSVKRSGREAMAVWFI